MNKLIVFAKNKNTYFIKRLIEEVDFGVELFDPWSDFELPRGDFYLVRTTGVYQSDLDLLILKSLPQDKISNPLATIDIFRSKKNQYLWLESHGYPILPWIDLSKTDDIQKERFFRLYPEVVSKPIFGQGGWGIELFNWDKFKGWWKRKKGKDESYLIQPYIKNAKEFRGFFIQGHPMIFLERRAQHSIAANFTQSGNAAWVEIEERYKGLLEQLARESGAFYGAIDFFIQEEQLILLELNAVPGIEQLERVTGKNIMKELCEGFIKKCQF
jgi:glutathione synthase/RimK-type ligase-like ATP-grasp enzyme